MDLSEACSNALLRSSISSHFRSWKDTVPRNYSYMLTRRTRNPALAVDWLPDKTVDREGAAELSLLVGEGNAEEKRLVVTRWKLTDGENIEIDEMDEIWKVVIPSDINRVRHMPQMPSIAALQCAHSLLIYTLRSPVPSLTLEGQTLQGFGLDWNPMLLGTLVSGGYDKGIRLWDVQMATALNRTVNPVKLWAIPSGIEDIIWSQHTSTLCIASTSTGQMVQIDTRATTPVLSTPVHSGPCYSLSFNHLQPSLIATAGADQLIAIWDLRMTGVRLGVFKGHNAEVVVVKWAPFSEKMLASGGKDRVVKVWNAGGREETKAAFTHEGHVSEVSDICWHPSERLLLASSSEESVQIWAVQGSILGED